ncbi:MAG: radical SAM protein [Nannocystis sp.]|nr:radical SAM protein HxsC4 [Nannocystis sp.]MBA3548754.1 radical SAM protein [Nannocystis sp.]
MSGAGDIAQRIAQQRPRVHILTGTVCNNNCIFCMEEDREGREVTNSATSDESVQWILGRHAQYEEVCFTSGEPTTNRRLPHWVRMAKTAGVRWISIMTNGRALSHEPYARGLMAAGLNRFYISIHGHTLKLHEGLTRTPGSFDQTVAGIDVIAKYRRLGINLHTSTVVTRRNLPHLADIYRFLRAHGVEQVVFNVMQANGRANTYFEQLFPTYTEIAAAAATFLAEAGQRERPVQAYFVDIPLCTTTRLPDHNRGYVEDYTHFEPPNPGHDIVADPDSRRGGASGELVQIRRSDLDDSARRKRPECRSCRHDAVCEGVWGNYLRHHGWHEFVPVPLEA